MPTKEELELQKSQAESREAVAKAVKTEAEAVKAQMEAVSSVGAKGDVTVKDKAGTTEASLLAARAVKTAARKIMEAVPDQASKKVILLYSAAEVPNIQAHITFNAQVRLVENAFEYAEDISKKLLPAEFRAKGFEMVGLALGAIQLLSGLLKTDYTVGNIDVNFEKDTILIHALAGLIAGYRKDLEVKLPAVYIPVTMNDDSLKFLEKFNELSRKKQNALAQESNQVKIAADFTNKAKSAVGDEKEKLEKEAVKHTEVAIAWKAAIALYDNFLSKYTTVDEKGVAPLSQIVKESTVANSLLSGDLLMIVKLHTSGGSYYTVKNIWTTIIPIIPLYYLGGVVASFILFDGKQGNVITSGVFPVHSDFIRANKFNNKIE